MSSKVNSVKSIYYALAANLTIAIAKMAAAFLTGSGSMMAESIHSLADTSNQLLLLLGIKRAKRPPTPEFPLGYGKAVYFWSFIVAIILFSMGGLFSIFEGVHKFMYPEPLTHPVVALVVLVFSLVAEGISLWGCLQEVNKIRHGRSLARWFKETRESELIVVFGEDFAALLGLSCAFFAVLLSMLTSDPLFDAIGSVLIGLLLVIIAILIGKEIKALLIGQGVDPIIKERMLQFLGQRAEIEEVYSFLTFQLGKDVMVAVKAKMAPVASVEALIESINRCESEFKKRFPEILWLFFEPDTRD